MCRHLAYAGSPRTLHALLYEPPYSLQTQGYAPRITQHCLLNAEGFGAGWYTERATAVRYRRAQPIWTDASFADVAQAVSASCVVAAIRSATPGFPVDESCAQPFRAGRWLFSHNGRVEGFGGVEAKLRELAGDLADVPEARAAVDSALLFAIAAGRWRAGRSLGEGLADVVTRAAALAPGRYNLLAADGRELAATRAGDSLFVRTGRDEQRGSWVVIASEPYDDEPGWEEVPDNSLVTASSAGFTINPLR